MEAVRVVDLRVGDDAGEDVLLGTVLTAHVVRVVRGDKRQPALLAQLDQRSVDVGLAGHALMHHQLKVVAVLEHLAVPAERLVCRLDCAVLQAAAQFT